MQIRYQFSSCTRIWVLGAMLLGIGGSFATLPVVAAPAASAQASVKIELKAFKVVDGKLEAAEKANPGDVIEYQARYANSGTAAAQSLVAQLPIPAGLAYVGNSAEPAKFQASTDGKNFAPAPLTRSVKNPDGTTQVVNIPLSEYRALRWQLGALAPGKSVTVSARARLKTFADKQAEKG